MNHKFAHILGGSRWLMEPKAYRAMVKRAESATPEAIQAAVKAYHDHEPRLMVAGDVAVIDVCGPITYRRSFFSMYFGGAAIEDLQAQFRMALADSAVRTVVFRFDSFGGCVDMVPEFADEIFAARGQKPIIAIADNACCSAAEWLAAQADTNYVSASSIRGSVGVYYEHEDVSEMLAKAGVKVTIVSYGEHKADGNEYEPLSDDARAEMQAQVDQVGEEFDGAMARGRGVSTSVVLKQFGQGKVFRGKLAIAAGLADKMGTFGQVMGKLTKGRGMVGARAEAGSSTLVLDEAGKRGMQADIARMAALEFAIVPQADCAETVEPEDGECPDGYELGEDEMCHLMPPAEVDAKASARAQADVDLTATTLALVR